MNYYIRLQKDFRNIFTVTNILIRAHKEFFWYRPDSDTFPKKLFRRGSHEERAC